MNHIDQEQRNCWCWRQDDAVFKSKLAGPPRGFPSAIRPGSPLLTPPHRPLRLPAPELARPPPSSPSSGRCEHPGLQPCAPLPPWGSARGNLSQTTSSPHHSRRTNMILTKILLAYHISRTAPRAGRCTRGWREAWRSHPAASRCRLRWKQGVHAKVRKDSLGSVFLNYSKNKTSR